MKKNNIAYFKSIKPHKTGTDRIAEFADDMKSDLIINIQGDEPFVRKEDLSKIIGVFKNDRNKKTIFFRNIFSLFR